ncbi:RNA pseudouridylate synthase-like protein [Leptomonas seymouri]|uniref:RNA pseudouridylate synthase-like protein n=1 Tax=Leptomonas seymouri TaxID=5684 RepID=A0A0N1IME7_LEPSE|nr:RNA pseudouridylate synthase-like protein [Leptomonas seymouri]|eukprot:KPI90153.1 RNA pseudouridylate synthase-like protein [Leptomonas seymouri]
MPRELRYCRPKSQPAETLLSYLSHKFTYLTHDAWTHHLSEGHVFVNGAVFTAGDYVLQQGDILRFAPPRSLEPRIDEENICILYEDASFLVCAKNGNLPVAEGGRYCENTLIGVLKRLGSRAFYTADTVVGGAVSSGDACKVFCGYKRTGVVNSALPSKEELLSEEESGDINSECTTVPPSGKRSRELSTPNEVDTAPAVFPNAALTGARSTFLTVQRLDRETSGVLVLCKRSGVAKKIAHQLESQTRRCSAAVEARLAGSRAAFTCNDFDQILQQIDKTVCKTYTAVLLGAAPLGETMVVNYMGTMQSCPAYSQDTAHSQLKRLKMCCAPLPSPSANTEISKADSLSASQWGRVACTRVRVLASSETLGVSCVQVELLTGRSHQIRVHCASLGYPIVGDKLYTCVSRGVADGCAAVSDAVYLARVRNEESFLLVENGATEGRRMWCRRHLLHATELQFEHPEKCTAEVMRFVSSPADFFARDVRFESPQDAHSFRILLAEAFEQCKSTKQSSV